MAEINLLDTLPQSKRNLSKRASQKTAEDIAIAKRYGKEFFDGERRHGYGGYRYDGRWVSVAKRMAEHYKLPADARILDIGCAKGFLMHDFKTLLPECEARGLEVSEYAKATAHPGLGERIDIGSCVELPYGGDYYDLVISINSIHNVPLEGVKRSLREIERVAKPGAGKFVTMDAWRTEEEHRRLLDWVLTAETYMSVDDWVALFEEVGYTGDYWWFIP